LLVVPEAQAYIRAMANFQTPRIRAQAFCERFGLRLPILLAPMAGVPAPALPIAVANAGGLAACGAVLMQPDAILQWARTFRAGSDGPFQFNLWIPDPVPHRDQTHEALVREFLAQWGPPVSAEMEVATLPSFDAQCAAVLEAAPSFVSSVMGVYPDRFVAQLKDRGIRWFANVSTVAEARTAEAAIVDAVRIPVVATGGIADARGIAAALVLGASAVQIGTGFLRCPEAGIPSAWADTLAQTSPEGTMVTRAFSGRAGRSIATAYARAAAGHAAPAPAPYPIQRALTKAMREKANRDGDIERMQAWAGQSAALARAEPAATLTTRLWQDAQPLLA
jgi:nitronate monooxygenase